jgi:hypothetical protein
MRIRQPTSVSIGVYLWLILRRPFFSLRHWRADENDKKIKDMKIAVRQVDANRRAIVPQLPDR